MLTTFFTWFYSLMMFTIYEHTALACATTIRRQKANLLFFLPTLTSLALITPFVLCLSIFISRLLPVVPHFGGLPAGISKGLPAWMLLLQIKPFYNVSAYYFSFSEQFLVTPGAPPQYIVQMLKQNTQTLYLPEASAQNKAGQARGIQP
jgi:hypothetical protein